jgi:DNA-binding NarL/FixJ family response regulator
LVFGAMSLVETAIDTVYDYGMVTALPGVAVGLLLALCPREPAAAAVLGSLTVLANYALGTPGHDGAVGVRVVTELKPDVVLLDVRMPGMDGLEAARRILATDLPTRVIVLTTFYEDEYVAAALRAGVSGFLLTVGPPEDLVVAVRTVAAGQGLLDPAVTLRVIESFAAAPSPDPARAGQLAQLTERETDVLGLVAAGLTNAEIAARLYLGEATVKTHVSRVLLSSACGTASRRWRSPTKAGW